MLNKTCLTKSEEKILIFPRTEYWILNTKHQTPNVNKFVSRFVQMFYVKQLKITTTDFQHHHFVFFNVLSTHLSRWIDDFYVWKQSSAVGLSSINYELSFEEIFIHLNEDIFNDPIRHHEPCVICNAYL